MKFSLRYLAFGRRRDEVSPGHIIITLHGSMNRHYGKLMTLTIGREAKFLTTTVYFDI